MECLDTACPAAGKKAGQIKYSLDLPFPVSTNRMYRSNRSRVHTSAEYAAWKRTADGVFYTQIRNVRPQLLGRFRISIVLGQQYRGGKGGRGGAARSDGDNRIKCVLDWCQRSGLIKNDNLCDGGTWDWGEAPSGCRITLEGELWK